MGASITDIGGSGVDTLSVDDDEGCPLADGCALVDGFDEAVVPAPAVGVTVIVTAAALFSVLPDGALNNTMAPATTINTPTALLHVIRFFILSASLLLIPDSLMAHSQNCE
jgi:hypothetical protein